MDSKAGDMSGFIGCFFVLLLIVIGLAILLVKAKGGA